MRRHDHPRAAPAFAACICRRAAYLGHEWICGELGHLPIPSAVLDHLNGRNPHDNLEGLDSKAKCSCGFPLHLEAIAGARALADRFARSGYELPTSGRERSAFIHASLKGELEPREVHALKDVGRVIGGALASPILMLDPHSITLTGPLATEHVRDGVLEEKNAWKHAVERQRCA